MPRLQVLALSAITTKSLTVYWGIKLAGYRRGQILNHEICWFDNQPAHYRGAYLLYIKDNSSYSMLGFSTYLKQLDIIPHMYNKALLSGCQITRPGFIIWQKWPDNEYFETGFKVKLVF